LTRNAEGSADLRPRRPALRCEQHERAGEGTRRLSQLLGNYCSIEVVELVALALGSAALLGGHRARGAPEFVGAKPRSASHGDALTSGVQRFREEHPMN